MQHLDWHINRIQYPVYNLGEGKRLAIWVQGCNLACKGCISQSLWNTTNGKKLDILDLALKIEQIESHFDGISITGGEPFQQYKSFIAFCAYIKKRTNLSIQVYSGYYLEELKELHPDLLFLRCIDWLIDGRYEEGLHATDNSRGSTNQSIYKIEQGTATMIGNYQVSNKWSLNMSDDLTVNLTGIPQKDELKEIEQQLESLGIAINFSKW
ncbi:MAG: anaerobic ribonucleoside-triphosphate reductase activating protein [Maribacter sp.]|jgi:anaerobic ribonucleoside-triphosphate reductase activating protein